MSEKFDSIYPEFLRSGLGKLNHLDAHRDLLSLFAALEHFRRDLHEQESMSGILQVSHRYIAGLNLFRTAGFYLVNPADYGFELSLCVPEAEHANLERVVNRQIQTGRFAWSLRQTSSVFFQASADAVAEQGVLHALALANQVLGMFCGLLHHELTPTHEITFSLLSMLLGASADAMATLRKTAQLTNQIRTLSGLLPICAWCKKIRDDQGYWEQIEDYVKTHSDASFSHGICPECKESFFHNYPTNR